MATALSTMEYVHRIGDTETLTIPIRNSSGTAVDCSGLVSGTTLLCTARAYPGSATETFDQSTTGITLAGTTTGVTLAFTAAALATVTPGRYAFTVTATPSSVTTTYEFELILKPLMQ